MNERKTERKRKKKYCWRWRKRKKRSSGQLNWSKPQNQTFDFVYKCVPRAMTVWNEWTNERWRKWKICKHSHTSPAPQQRRSCQHSQRKQGQKNRNQHKHRRLAFDSNRFVCGHTTTHAIDRLFIYFVRKSKKIILKRIHMRIVRTLLLLPHIVGMEQKKTHTIDDSIWICE